jgi:hypothetical protein
MRENLKPLYCSKKKLQIDEGAPVLSIKVMDFGTGNARKVESDWGTGICQRRYRFNSNIRNPYDVVVPSKRLRQLTQFVF